MATNPDTVFWTSAKRGHRLEAVQRVVRDLGLELRFSVDGKLYHSQIYRFGRTCSRPSGRNATSPRRRDGHRPWLMTRSPIDRPAASQVAGGCDNRRVKPP